MKIAKVYSNQTTVWLTNEFISSNQTTAWLKK
jgi:hypothetical protein